MDDKIKILFPNLASAADEPNSAEKIAASLERIAAEIRKGERTPEYGAFVYLQHDTRVTVCAVGDSTKHQNIFLFDLAHALALEHLFDRC